MKFSIIIATYNTAKSIAVTLDSILSQDFSDYEVVIIDGGSTDGTSDLLKIYEPRFGAKLRWSSEPDNGIYNAMNKGVATSHGDWLYFLGSGDYFKSIDVLGFVAEEVAAHNPDVVYGSVQWGETSIISHGKFTRSKLIEQNICHQAIFVRRSVFQKTGLFDESYKIAADYIFNMKWFNDSSIKKLYIDRVVSVYDTTGVSSLEKDQKFAKEKPELVRKYFPKGAIVMSDVRVFARRLKKSAGYLLRWDISGLQEKVRNHKDGKK